MKRSKKSNRISWAPDVNLCQVRIFSSEDCPSQVGPKDRDNLQSKASWILHSEGMKSNALPPGFGGCRYVKSLKGELSSIPQIKWKIPPKFALSCNWHMAAGEEGKETEAQKLREMRVLEAVYPRLSDIPPTPSVSLDIDEYHHDDKHTPLIPITPIEEEEDPTGLLSGSATPVNTSSSYPAALPQEHLASETPKTTKSHTSSLGSHTNENPALGKFSGSEADVFAAASAAFSAILKSTEQGSLIDTDLLVQIFNNPKMIEKLMSENGAPTNTGSTPKAGPNLVTPSLPLSRPEPDMVLSSRLSKGHLAPVHNMVQPTLSMITPKPVTVSISALKQASSSVPLFSQERNVVLPPRPATVNSISPPKQAALSIPLCSQELNVVLPPRPATGNLIPQPNTVWKTTAPLMKDMNYYKALIMQHGGESQNTPDQQNLLHSGSHPWGFQEIKLVNGLKKRNPKIQRPCIYFNSSKGCRNGSNCPYQHNLQAARMLEAPSAKRIKLGMEITGRT